MSKDNSTSVNSINLEDSLLTQEDALKCLLGQVEVILPVPNVRACNNLDEYLLKSTQKSAQKRSQHKPPTPPTGSSSNKTHKSYATPSTFSIGATPLVRNFDKILKNPQDATPVKQKRIKPDVFSKAEQLDEGSGPLSLLKERMGQTVKILIRRRRKVSYISRTIEYKGVLVLFDKHMNVYLKDVIESFKYASDNKLLKRARHRESLMLRGDNIILVS